MSKVRADEKKVHHG